MFIVRQWLRGSIVLYVQTIHYAIELIPTMRITWHRLAKLLRIDFRWLGLIIELDIRELIHGHKDDSNQC